MTKRQRKIERIKGTTEAWENGTLGETEEFAAVADLDDILLDDSVGLQMISIRLQKSMIEELKLIAQMNGLGYQPLIKRVLTRFVEGEKKAILIKMAKEQQKKAAGQTQEDHMPATLRVM